MEAVGRLAGGVAHDFNNVLSVILGHAERLQRALGAEHPARADTVQIISAAERAAVLTRQLLAFGRRQVLEPRIVRLDSVANEARGSLDHVLGERIDLTLQAPSALGRVRADPGQMTEVLLNLAVNARDAMPDGGRLTIEFADVALDERYAREHTPCEPGRYVMMAVTDTGTGMDAETSQRVFEPFFTTKPGAHGAGLGLATVYGIVKQSGGFIWVYSEPGVGTSFKVYLPRVDEPAEEGRLLAEPDAARPVRRGARLLVVEDDDGVREIMADLLEAAGYAVSAIGHPLVALETVAALGEAPDLLVTDVVMPGMSGRDLAQRLRSRQPDLRVIFVSGYAGEALARRGEIDSGDRFLLKPFSEKAFLLAVAEALESIPWREAR
jgi:CheY-like chemotaxis protein